MNKKTLTAAILAIASGSSMASNQLYVPSGMSTTLGPMSNPKVNSSGLYNPAGSYSSTNRFSGVFDTTGSVSLKGLGTFLQAGEDLAEEGDNFQSALDTFQQEQEDYENDSQNNDPPDTGPVLDAVDDLEATLDSSIQNMADLLSIKPGGSLTVPARFSVPYLSGMLGLGVSYMGQARATALYSNVAFNIDSSVIEDSEEDFDAAEFLDTNSSLYVKSGRAWTFDMSYAQALPGLNLFNTQVVLGGRGKVIGASLYKGVYPFSQFVSEATTEDGDINNYVTRIQDDAQQGLIEGDLQFQPALDLGITVEHPRWHLGITGYNLNRPQFEYNTLGINCGSISDQLEQDACYYADYFDSVGDIAADETHVMNPRFTVDGSLQFLENRIALGASADVIPGVDLFGDTSQDLNLSLLLQPNSWYIPRARLGLKKDLEDFDPTTVAFGLSLFNVVQFDQSVSAVWGDLFGGSSTEQLNALRGASTSLSLNASF